MKTSRHRYLILISFVWTLGIYFTLTELYSQLHNYRACHDRFDQLQNEVNSLKQRLAELNGNIEHEKLQSELKHLKRQLAIKTDCSTIHHRQKPTLEYEQLRRKLEIHTRELFYFTIDQMNKISHRLSHYQKNKWNNVILRVSDQIRFLLASIRNLTNVDGYQAWREREHESLSKLVQARLHALQNPSKPCAHVQRLTYDLNKYCGYGCQIHGALRSFLVAYIFGQPMILISDEWVYNHGGFEEIYQPISNVCNQSSAAGGASWAKLVELSLISDGHPPKDYMPMAIPQDLSDRLIHMHEHPFVWFIGQLAKYFLRPQPWLNEFINKIYEAIQFQRPIVGIHVRRTDKQSEAAYHNVSEYMKYVEDYFMVYQYQNPNINFTKRIYLATDEPKIFEEIRTKYPDYVVHGNISSAESAQMNSRYGRKSLKGVLLDIHFLSLCDYLVCTLSSGICRLAYETMQQRVVDGAWRVQSLDDVYYFENQYAHNQRSLISHRALWPNEFSFERGDVIHTEGNHWDGFSKGSDLTNGQSGLYPSYKTEEIIKIGKMYTYPDVHIETD